MTRPNQYPGECGKIGRIHLPDTCHCKVATYEGVLERIDNAWVTFCYECYAYRQGKLFSVGERKLAADGTLNFPYKAEALPLIRAFPGYKFHDSYWTVSVDEADRQRVLEIADELNIEVDPLLRQVRESYIDSDAKEAGLYPYQLEGVHWLSKRNKALLCDDMGLGKTIQALMSLEFDDCVIVVAPAHLKWNWRNEISVWRPDFEVEVLIGKESFRIPNHGEILITNYEALPRWLIAEPTGRKVGAKRRIDLEPELIAALKKCTLIADEAHLLSNARTQRSQKVWTLARLVQKVWFLTGTPVKNRPPQLYDLLDAGNMNGETFGGFDRFYNFFNAKKRQVGRRKWATEWGQPSAEVPEILKRVMLRRERKDVLPELPDKTYQTLVVNGCGVRLRKKMDNLYGNYEEFFIQEQLPPFEEFSKVRAELASHRIPAMREYIEQVEEQDIPLVVFSAHKSPIEALESRDGWTIITGDIPTKHRQERVDAFQAGEYRGIGLTIGAGGMGFNLFRAYLGLFVDLDWTPALNLQAEDRLARIGQKHDHVLISRMVANHPLDMRCHDLIAKKMRMIKNTVQTNNGC